MTEPRRDPDNQHPGGKGCVSCAVIESLVVAIAVLVSAAWIPSVRAQDPTSAPTATPTVPAAPTIPAVAPYFSIGDSISDAEGASSRDLGYVALFAAEAWEILDLPGEPSARGEFGRRGGETSTSILAVGGQLDLATAEIRSRNSDTDAANDVRLISVDIGGNDFRALTRSDSPCAVSVVSPDCQAAVAQVIGAFSANYPIILQRIREAAGPDAIIVAMAFYNPFSGTGQAVDAPGDIVAAQMTAQAKTVATASPVDAVWVDLAAVFQGKAPTLTRIMEDPPNIHANDAGHAAIAAAMTAALRAAVEDAEPPAPPETGDSQLATPDSTSTAGIVLVLAAVAVGALSVRRVTRG